MRNDWGKCKTNSESTAQDQDRRVRVDISKVLGAEAATTKGGIIKNKMH